MFNEANSIKIILLGEAGTGKTNLINVCCNLKFNPDTISSSTASFLEKKIEINNVKYSLKLWDTAGQEIYRSLNTIFIKDSKICILVYDITNRKSFEELDYWKNTVESILGNKTVLAVVGNKIDLYKEEKITEEEGEKYAKNIEAFFKITSAKNDGEGFANFVNELVEKYLQKNKFNEWEYVENDEDNGRISIDKNVHQQKKKNNFCLLL